MMISLDHIVLNVENVEAAADFYEKIIGFKIERLEQFKKGFAPFPSARVNEEAVIDLFPPRMWRKDDAAGAGKNNLNHFCLTFSEKEWKKLVERLKQYEIEIESYADNNWGAKGIGISIYFRDPDGNQIEARFYPNL